ncbi:MAG: hypothetical protein HY298_08465 [Verrucomicrobia bacterium]|nr:hypothetical protein [Verrucomicrobiota bacterium]
MKNFSRTIAAIIAITWLLSGATQIRAQGTAFTYQGRLADTGSPANGNYDLRFTVYDSTNSPGTIIAGPLTNAPTVVSNGLFTVKLDFGASVFTGAARWLEIAVRTNGSGAFATLTPRQHLTPTPYAIYAGGANAAGISGTLPATTLNGTYTNAVNFNNGANSFDGSFYGQFFGSSFIGGNFVGNFIGTGSGLADVWHTGGNLGTTAGVNFLGTTDNEPLQLHVNGQRVLRLEPVSDLTGFLPNVIGGKDNYVVPGTTGAFIGGGGGVGLSNTIASTEGVIAGGFLNHIEAGNAHASAIGGGFDNTIEFGAARSVIAGGHANRIGTNATGAVVSGGEVNDVLDGAFWGTIGGGFLNTIQPNASYSTIGGGVQNTIQTNASYSFIGGGSGNLILPTAAVSVIGGGFGNTNGGLWATIPGGYANVASGTFSFAAGHQAKARHDGAFVWADSTSADFVSTASDQFLVRASGGLFFYNGAPGVNVDQFNANNGDIGYALRFGIGSGEGIGSKRTPGGNQYGLDFYTQFTNRMAITQSGLVGIGTNNPAAALHVVGGGTTNLALKISNGGISVSGAGIGTSTPAFVHRASAANIEGGATHRTTITHPLTDGDHDAILIVTPNYNPGETGNILDTHPIGVFYNSSLSKWQIFHQDFAAVTTDAAYNVLVIKP